jgi:hypothetical protein
LTRCLGELSVEWTAAWRTAGEPREPTEHLDLGASTILVLSGDVEMPTSLDIAAVLRPLGLLTGPDGFPHRLVFDLALALLSPQERPLELAAASLGHHSSSIRFRMLRNAWLVRGRLGSRSVAEPLLANVETTLAYWELSLALCLAVHPCEADFWATVTAYRPSQMPAQFDRRIAAARADVSWQCPVPLIEYERSVRRYLAAWLTEQFRRRKVVPGRSGLTDEPFALTTWWPPAGAGGEQGNLN